MCFRLINFANSGPSKCQYWSIYNLFDSLKEFLKTVNFEKIRRQQKYHDKLPMMQKDEMDLQAKKNCLRWFAYNTGTDQGLCFSLAGKYFISKLASGEISKFLANLSTPYQNRVNHCELRWSTYQKWHCFRLINFANNFDQDWQKASSYLDPICLTLY